MSWNYRVVKTHYEKSNYPKYGIKEVYYNADNDGNLHPDSWSEDDMTSYGESLQELINDLRLMNQAFSKPILELVKDEFGQEKLIEIGDE